LKAILRQHPFHAADGNGKPILVEFLGNNLWRDVGVEIAVADNLTDDFVGSAVVTFGPGFVAFERLGPIIFEQFQDLVISLSAIAKLLGRGGGAQAFTVAFHEHGQLEGDFIIFLDGQGSGWAIERGYPFLEFDHGLSPPGKRYCASAERDSTDGSICQIKYGGNIGSSNSIFSIFSVNIGIMNVVFGRKPPYFILLKWADILKNPNHFRGGPDSTTCIWKIMPPLKISAFAGITKSG
jgi:hypothetical protein